LGRGVGFEDVIGGEVGDQFFGGLGGDLKVADGGFSDKRGVVGVEGVRAGIAERLEGERGGELVDSL